jgi:hypothetical protein
MISQLRPVAYRSSARPPAETKAVKRQCDETDMRSEGRESGEAASVRSIGGTVIEKQQLSWNH